MKTLSLALWTLLLLQGGPEAGVFESALKVDDLDPSGFVEWVDGAERAVESKGGPKQVVWTSTTAGEWNGLSYGGSKASGTRHLKVAFKKPLDLGTVVVRGGGLVSALKSGAAGKLDDEAQWIPAQRLKKGAISRDEVEKSEFGVWVLPSGTKTQGLRFSHTSTPSDKDYAGWLGGAYLLSARYGDLAGASVPTASANEHHAAKIINGKHDDWGPWDNMT